MKSGIFSLIFLCLVLLTPVKYIHSNSCFKCIPQKIMDSLNTVDINDSPRLNNVEAEYICYMFNLDTINNNLSQKKVSFLTGNLGTTLVYKKKVFSVRKNEILP